MDGSSTYSTKFVWSGNTVAKPTDPTKSGKTFTGWYTDIFATKLYDFSTPVTSDLTLYAGWSDSSETCYVQFKNGSALYMVKYVVKGSTVAKPDDPTSYTFTGWYTNILCTNLYDFDTPVTSNLTLYAGWKTGSNTHKVTIKNIGDYTSGTISIEVDDGTTLAEALDNNYFDAPSGYTLVGWFSDAAGTKSYSTSTPITADITVYRKWAAAQTETYYIVTFETNGGSAVASQNVKSGECVQRPADPTRDGSVFKGWYKNKYLLGEYDFSTPVTSDITLYAGWTTNSSSSYHYVTIKDTGDYKSGSTITVQVQDGKTLASFFESNSINIQPSGYTFGGWFSDEAATLPYDINTTPVTADITVYRKWVKNETKITVKYYVPSEMDNTILTGNIVTSWRLQLTEEIGKNEILPPPGIDSFTASVTNGSTTFTNTYYISGWYSSSSYTAGTEYSFMTAVPESALSNNTLSLYAKYSAFDYCYVYFISNNGDDAIQRVVQSGQTVTEPTAPTRSGYTFTGWYTDEACTNAYDFTSKVTADITLYAGWQQNAVVETKYTVTFVDTLGNNRVSIKVKSGELINTGSVNFSHTGYTLEGWYTDEAYTHKFDIGNTPVTSDLTLYSKWVSGTVVTEKVTVNYYVQNNATGLEELAYTVQVNKGSAAAKVARSVMSVPVIDNTVVKAWYYYDKDGNYHYYDFTSPITADLDLHEELTGAEGYFLVYYSMEDGNDRLVVLAVKSGEKAVNIQPFARTGYTFVCWRYILNGQTIYDFTKPVTEETLLKAEWQADKTYTVTFRTFDFSKNSKYCYWFYNSNYAFTEYLKQTAAGGSTVNMPADPTQKGYSFEGWYTDLTFKESSRFDPSTPINKDITLYAYHKLARDEWDIVVDGEGFWKYEFGFPTLADAWAKIKTLGTDYITVTLNKDATLASNTLPKMLKSQFLINGNGHTLTLRNTKTLAGAYEIILQDVTLKSVDNNGYLTTLTVNGTKKPITLDNVNIIAKSCTISAKYDLELRNVLCSNAVIIKGSTNNDLMIDNAETDDILTVNTLTGFKNIGIGGTVLLEKTLTANNLTLYGDIYVRKAAAVTIKGAFEGVTDNMEEWIPTLVVEQGFKPITLNGSVAGVAGIVQSDSSFTKEVPMQKGQLVFKTKLNNSTLSKTFLTNVDDSFANWNFYNKSGKVTVEDYMLKLSFAEGKDKTNTYYFAVWNDLIKYINDRKISTAEYTVTLLNDLYLTSAPKLPTKGRYRTLTIDGNGKTFMFKGTTLTLTGPTILRNITVKAVNAKGVTISWKLKSSAYLTEDNADLVYCDRK